MERGSKWWEFLLVIIVVLPILFFPLIGSLVYIIMSPSVMVTPTRAPESASGHSADGRPSLQTAIDSRLP
jgi:hypothetical protein